MKSLYLLIFLLAATTAMAETFRCPQNLTSVPDATKPTMMADSGSLVGDQGTQIPLGGTSHEKIVNLTGLYEVEISNTSNGSTIECIYGTHHTQLGYAYTPVSAAATIKKACKFPSAQKIEPGGTQTCYGAPGLCPINC